MKKYTRIILPVYDMQKYCLKCRSFALFHFLRFWVQNEKKRFIFAISDFPKLQYARKSQSFLPRCIKDLSGKSLRNNIVPAFFYIKL